MTIFISLIIIFLAYDIYHWLTDGKTFSKWVRKTGEEHLWFAVLVVILLVGLVAHFFL